MEEIKKSMSYKESTFLKVMGILSIIFGAIGSLAAIMGSLGAAALSVAGLLSSTLIVSVFIALADAAVMLTAGIVAVANSKKPQKAKLCIAFGILMIALRVANAVLVVSRPDLFAESATGVAASGLGFSTIVGFAVPVLYTIAAFRFAGNSRES